MKTKYIAAGIAFIFIILAIYFLFIRQQSEGKIKTQENANIVKNVSDVDVGKRPYITLVPTSDGAEIIISIEKMSDFEKIEYDLPYLEVTPKVPVKKLKGAQQVRILTRKMKNTKSRFFSEQAQKGLEVPIETSRAVNLPFTFSKGI